MCIIVVVVPHRDLQVHVANCFSCRCCRAPLSAIRTHTHLDLFYLLQVHTRPNGQHFLTRMLVRFESLRTEPCRVAPTAPSTGRSPDRAHQRGDSWTAPLKAAASYPARSMELLPAGTRIATTPWPCIPAGAARELLSGYRVAGHTEPRASHGDDLRREEDVLGGGNCDMMT